MNITVIGAGISGLALARAVTLHHPHHRVQVHEAQATLRSIGGGLIIPPNSARVLDRLGLGHILDAYGVPLTDMQIIDAKTGRTLYHRPQTAVAQRHGRGLYSLSRTVLHRSLAETLPAGTIHTGHELSGVEYHFDGVAARFTNGAETTADLLVSAEGRESRTRQLTMPETQLVHTGQVAYRGLTTIAPLPQYHNSFVEYWGRGRRFTFFRLAENLTYWHAPVTQTPGATRKKTDLLREYRDFPEQVIELIAHTDAEHIHGVDLSDIRPLPHWHRGKVVLIGDAAHATSPNLGQGAAQALEDAYSLATQLAPLGDPDLPTLSAALGRYQQERESAANAVVHRSRQIGQLGQAGGAVRLLRNIGMTLSPELARERIEAFYE